ncbi:hypothetical protein BAUCODRAFT_71724 [Baudoinia panamericana UAMH 10762]|uniref:AB hydrolase-1 domain-containing protein n=1 Tax=Baudoinia panamericana (strain UAMH 10762) TaxID=717646 RepID=M2MGB6_BAUPA|nr:uncharacterized protein BAUCODRAFT_71724 [Baudoinia panamericana UAMH 10762]EMC95671.1 hypothetical protein BAUCODRAFT_71724 [Baudoinia panamericana UAMH 10762]
MSNNLKPSILLIPGSWHNGPKHYYQLIDRLRNAGYEVDALEMPCVCDDPKDKHYSDDYEHVRNALRTLADQGKDIVMVMHSRGGHIGSDACKGFGKAERAEAGHLGGIVHMVYLAAFAIAENESIFTAFGQQPAPFVRITKTSGGEISFIINPEHYIYHDCPAEEVKKAIADLRPSAAVTETEPSTFAGWKHYASTYLLCENDQALLPRFQEMFLCQPGAKFNVERCDAGHSPFMSRPDFTAEVVRRACGEKI